MLDSCTSGLSLISILSIFAILGFTKAILEPAAKKVFQWKLLKTAPLVLKILDPMVPQLLIDCTPEELDRKIRDIFEQVTGEDWSTPDLTAFYSMWDLRKAAGSAQRVS